MVMLSKCFLPFIVAVIAIAQTAPAKGTFDIDGQILQRTELRQGYGALRKEDASPAFFIGQRSRVNANYSADRVDLKMSGQDIRIWGSTSQMKTSDNLFSIHEAWGRFRMLEHFYIKAGRQELAYDEHRFLGNVDWALQARAHDILLLQYERSPFSVHGGFAFNQERPGLTGHYYDRPAQYKTAQFFWSNYSDNSFDVSTLFWNEGLQYIKEQPDGTFSEDINFVQTFGLTNLEYSAGHFLFRTFYHHQTGKDTTGHEVNAYNTGTNVNATFPVSEDHNLSITAGFEILSGQSQIENEETSHAFTPKYGTNHRFNGFMDYFYVGGRHLNSVGLQDYSLRIKYEFNEGAFVGINGHYFMADAGIADEETPEPDALMDDYLGTEVDLTAGMVLFGPLSLQAGYSQMFGSSSLEALHNGNHKKLNHWGYIALHYRPGMDAPFTGLKF